MDQSIPVAIQPLITDYVAALNMLRSHFFAVYVYGSVALGAFDERQSDIDIVALTQEEWTKPELKALKAIHKQLIQEHKPGKRLAVLYLPTRDLGKCRSEAAPYPYAADGKFHSAGRFDLNAVTWWLVKYASIPLIGPDPGMLPLVVSWADVIEDMSYNLNTYWARKAQVGLLFFYDYWIAFGVTTLCRILSTIEEGEIITKTQALTNRRDLLPARFSLLIDEASRIHRRSGARSLYRSRKRRRDEMLAFIRYARARGNRVLQGENGSSSR